MVWFRKILFWVKITIFLCKNTYLTSLDYIGNLKQLTVDFWLHSEHGSGLLKEDFSFIIPLLCVSFFKAIIVNHNLEIPGFVGLYDIKSSSGFTL